MNAKIINEHPGLTQERLKELLHYDPITGLFTHIKARQRVIIGSVAGSVDKAQGYIRIGIDGKVYPAQRLAWFYMTSEWPTHLIDHEDTERSNNVWTNLRPATRSQNAHNTKLLDRNTSGYKGVSFERSRNKWTAHVTAYGKRQRIGMFDTAEAADGAARAVREVMHGDFANHGKRVNSKLEKSMSITFGSQ